MQSKSLGLLLPNNKQELRILGKMRIGSVQYSCKLLIACSWTQQSEVLYSFVFVVVAIGQNTDKSN